MSLLLRHPLLMFGLLVTLLGGAHAYHVASCYGFRDRLENCSDDTYACKSTVHKDHPVPGQDYTSRRCHSNNVAELECWEKEGPAFGMTRSGNCFHFHGPYTDWNDLMDKCPGPGIEVAPRQGSASPIDITVCHCNEGEGCNLNCKCDASYGLCGAKPCPPPRYNCLQGDGLICGFPKRQCPGLVDQNVDGCFAIAADDFEGDLVKGCMTDLESFKCWRRKIELGGFFDYDTCIVTTYGELEKAVDACPKPKGLPVYAASSRDPNARVVYCQCKGEMCNLKKLKMPKKMEKECNCRCGASLGKEIWAFRFAVIAIGILNGL